MKLSNAVLAVSLSLGFLSFAGPLAAREKKSPKKVIAVADFEMNAQSYTSGGGWWNKEQVGTGMRSMLVEALLKTGKFTVVERGEGLQNIKEEQELKKSGSSRGSGAAAGELMAAQALFRGEITDFTPDQQGAKVSTGGFNLGKFGNLGNVGVGAKNASIATLVRYFDTSSGEVIDSFQSTGKATSVGFDVSGYSKIPFGTEAYTKTPIGKATNEVIKDTVDKIVSAMAKVPFQCKVIKATAPTIVLNVGEEGGISVGDRYEIWSIGEAMIDPDSGANLGSEREKIGVVKVEKVNPKFSTARFEAKPAADPKPGDVAQEMR